MTKIKREIYTKMLVQKQELLEKLLEAQLQLVSGGVKSYTIDDRTLTKFDLKEIENLIDSTAQDIVDIESMLSGNGARKAVGVVIRDI